LSLRNAGEERRRNNAADASFPFYSFGFTLPCSLISWAKGTAP